jgi:hydroxyacylglutathione hydrolase
MALNIKTLVFNAFQVNTYVISDQKGNCLLVDPACYSTREQEQLASFLTENNLTVQYTVNTHSHVDHVLGNSFVYRGYGFKPLIHRDGLVFYDHMLAHANTFGFEIDELIYPEEFLEEGQVLKLGDEEMKVHYTPGHADGSVCLVHEAGRWIVTGDLLFYLSIGRTDLPTGNLEKLLHSVRNKIFIYGDEYTLYPGHGNATTIGYERRNNPYL